jgi:hypothetical protein
MKKSIIYKKLSITVFAILFIFSFINVELTQDQATGKSENKTEKTQCFIHNLNVSNWFDQVFLNLVDNKNYNLNLSTESLVLFLDKEIVRDYVQISNFKSWLTEEGYNNFQFVVFVNGKDSQKT